MRNRDNSFDFIKGILIMLVVLGHALQWQYGEDCWNTWLFHFIYSFHMPLFLFVSGIFLKSCLKISFSEMLVQRFRRLLVPAIIFTAILLIIRFISNNNTFTGLWDIYVVCRTYWYLICLFILTAIYHIFFRGNRFVKTSIISAYLLGLFFYKEIPPFILIDCQVIRMFLIVGLGAYYGMNKENIHKIKHRFLWVTGAKILAIIEIICCRAYFGINLLAYPPIIRIVDGVIVSMAIFYICRLLYKCIMKYTPIVANHFITIGNLSLGIYLIHILFFKYLAYNKIQFEIISPSITIAALFILSYIISIETTKTIKKHKVKKYLLGETK